MNPWMGSPVGAAFRTPSTRAMGTSTWGYRMPLVIANRSGEEYRYRMLETVREYGQGLLVRTGELDTAFRRMVVWIVELVSRLEHDMRTPRQDAAIRAVLPERATARAAYECALGAGEQLTALRILSAVPLMPTAQRYAELQRLRRQVPGIPEAVLAQVRLTLGNLAFEIGNARESIEHATAAAEAFTTLGDVRLRAWTRYIEAMALWTAEGERREVASIFDEGLAVFDELDDDFGLA